MSLLDRANELVIVYPEVVETDSDGNIRTKPSDTGIQMWVMIQPLPQSGTSARRVEQDNEGFETEELYRFRFKRNEEMYLGAQSRIQWRDQYWSINGEPNRYNTSFRTRHLDYTIKRS